MSKTFYWSSLNLNRSIVLSQVSQGTGNHCLYIIISVLLFFSLLLDRFKTGTSDCWSFALENTNQFLCFVCAVGKINWNRVGIERSTHLIVGIIATKFKCFILYCLTLVHFCTNSYHAVNVRTKTGEEDRFCNENQNKSMLYIIN